MKYTITINDDDYLKFNIFYAWHSGNGKRSVRIAQLLMPILSVLVLLFFTLAGFKPGFILTEAVCLTALSVSWVLRAPKSLEKNVRNHIERVRKNGKLPYHACSEIEFLDPMIVERYDQGVFCLNYADVEELCFEEDFIYIFYTSLQALIIPHRCLGADKNRVIEFLVEKYKKTDVPM